MDTSYEQKLRTIFAICAKANPDLSKQIPPAPVRLADVTFALLLDMHARRSEQAISDLNYWWHRRDDDLTRQSCECVGFVFDRLLAIRPAL